MNFLSRLLTSAGLAALLGSTVTTVTEAAGGNVVTMPTAAGLVTAEKLAQAGLAAVDFRAMSLGELRGVVDRVVGGLADRRDVTPELAASIVTQSVLARIAAVGPMSPAIAEAVQATVAASVIDSFRSRSRPVVPERIVQAAAVGGALTGSVATSPFHNSTAHRDLATVDRDDVSAY